MDLQKFFDLGNKAVDFIKEQAQNGEDAIAGINALKNIFSKKPEDVTDKDVEENEKNLDAQIAKFNEELPEEK